MPSRESSPLTRRDWLRRCAAGGATLALGTGLYAWRVEPHWVEVTHHAMPFVGLPAALVGKRLVQISDLHVGPVVDNDYLRGVLRRLADLEPDYLAITGDFMTTRGDEEIDLTIETLREAPIADTPTVAVLGNHDYADNFRNAAVADRFADRLRDLGIRLLRNESIELDGLQVAGCDDLWARRADLFATLNQVELSRPTLCLSHNPDTVDLAGWTTFSGWVLSGHTHGGQCRFPLLGAPVLPIRNHRYARGHVRLSGGRNLYVNRGLGYSRRVRLGVRPEVTVFTLTTA
ncbi:putative metallophosphoesterase [Botrimarina colliarenosi]|uniref:Putative metallophosphoesterase n=2 Tax=Botrimarina colliarenosi TaxID=2528001 RepID=A0A5C6AMG1_9BACT|nr:putative metallophosphoesterase [Botrimarina colliarenosi]